jgi:hypothetical protein
MKKKESNTKQLLRLMLECKNIAIDSAKYEKYYARRSNYEQAAYCSQKSFFYSQIYYDLRRILQPENKTVLNLDNVKTG